MKKLEMKRKKARNSRTRNKNPNNSRARVLVEGTRVRVRSHTVSGKQEEETKRRNERRLIQEYGQANKSPTSPGVMEGPWAYTKTYLFLSLCQLHVALAR